MARRPNRHMMSWRIRDADEQRFAIGGHAPMNATIIAAHASADRPKRFTIIVRIHRIDHAGLLPGENNVLAVREGGQDRWGAEVEVGSTFFGAVCSRAATGAIPCVACNGLVGPGQFACFEPEGDDCVAEFIGRCRVILAGPEIEQTAVFIDRGN